MLALRMLGEIEILRGEERLALPPSRKTRALLAYLVGSGRPQRRERLCSMFWDIPDDPRGALRWSMSRLRALVDEPGRARIVANRETVAFDTAGVDIDLLALRALTRGGIDDLSTIELKQAAARFRGEFLEGLELPNQHDFQAWCVAEREELRRLQIRILNALAERHASDAEAALCWARQLVQVDPFNEKARGELLRLLVATGRLQEAESHFETAERLFREIGADAQERLARTWQAIRRRGPGRRAAPTLAIEPAVASLEATPGPAQAQTESWPMFGRAAELAFLMAAVERSRRGGTVQTVLVVGEPGIGKSRLLHELVARMRRDEVITHVGRAYDFGVGAAYGPWVDALGELPLPETAGSVAAGREQFFAAVAERVVGDGSVPVLLALDDIQWADEASADLLHHLVRFSRIRPLTIVMTARGGELPDNRPVSAVLRSLRHDGLVQDVRLDRLSAEQARMLAEAAAPDIDVDRIVTLSGGNPLYALELARDLAEDPAALPRSLKELVRDRVERFGPDAADVLRWASVLGPTVDMERLRLVAELDLDRFMKALEILERHALLSPVEHGDASGSYEFSHELVRQAIYTGLSEPRRRLMHLKIARLLQEGSPASGVAALDIANHAAAGGDARMAAESCVTVGRHCMRLFAHAEAMALVRQGQHYADSLPDPMRIERLIELTEIELGTGRPDDPADLIARIEGLAAMALDHDRSEHAGRCYAMLATLRWEGGAWSDAQRDTLRAELVSRASNDRERVLAMSETARCLAMLERDLDSAEALLLEAEALGKRTGYEPNAIADATALLLCHRGAFDEARALFQRARVVARRDGERASEFLALEHLVTLEIELGCFDAARRLCPDVVALAEKLRGGSELPFAGALDALCRRVHGDEGAVAAFDQALEELRAADAKHRLAFVTVYAARFLMEADMAERARILAEEALAAATILDRKSDMAIALATLMQIAARFGQEDMRASLRPQLDRLPTVGLSHNARRLAEGVALPQRRATVEITGQ